MNDAIRTIITMSLTGGALTVLLLLVKPLIRDRLPMSAQYYLWFVVVATLLIPVSKLMTLPVAVVPPISKTVDQYVITAEEAFMDSLKIPTVYDPETLALRPDGNPVKVQQPTFAITAVSLFMLFYPICTAFVLLCYLVSYWWYLLKLRRNRTLTDITAPVRVYKSAGAATPMLIGVFRPVIVLPLCEYTDEQLSNVLAHELTHLRRRDIIVKWLSVIAVSLHWFNPFAWLMRREIDRLCELSCDEAVISRYGVNEKQSYGDTLIAVVAEHKSPKSVLSTTMAESKRALKERLGAIMKHKKSTTIAIIISALLIIIAIGTVAVLGAGRANNDIEPGAEISEEVTPQTPSIPVILPPDELSPKIGIFEYDGNPEVVLGEQLTTDEETGWITLTDMIFIKVEIPDGTVAMQTYYAEAGSEAKAYIMTDDKWNPPHKNSYEPGSHPVGNSWRLSDNFPISFLGHIWAVTTDADGVEHHSGTVNAIYEPDKSGSSWQPVLSSWIPLGELPADYGKDQVVADGVYVNIHGLEIYNVSALADFYNAIDTGASAAFVRTMIYTNEGEPILTDYQYNGESYTVTLDTTRDNFGAQSIEKMTFKYLVSYMPPPGSGYLGAEPIRVFSNTLSITEEDLERGGYYALPPLPAQESLPYPKSFDFTIYTTGAPKTKTVADSDNIKEIYDAIYELRDNGERLLFEDGSEPVPGMIFGIGSIAIGTKNNILTIGNEHFQCDEAGFRHILDLWEALPDSTQP